MITPEIVHQLALIGVSQKDIDALEYLGNTFAINQSIYQHMQLLMLADFYVRVTRLPNDEFETLCQVARRIASTGCKNLNKSLDEIPEELRNLAQDKGILPPYADSVNSLRYISEAEQQLRAARDNAK